MYASMFVRRSAFILRTPVKPNPVQKLPLNSSARLSMRWRDPSKGFLTSKYPSNNFKKLFHTSSMTKFPQTSTTKRDEEQVDINRSTRQDRAEQAAAYSHPMLPVVWKPRIEMIEIEGELIIRAEVPGFKKDEIRVDVNARMSTLTISGERPFAQKSGETVHVMEREYGLFRRQFSIPKDVDYDGITANLHNGLLEILVPKSDETHPRVFKVDIEEL